MSIYDTLNEQQREAVYQTEGPVLILAGAGSGKTRVLTHRTAYLIEEKGVNPYHIMAITFTNKAAGEMRERIDKIVGFGSESIWVSTFHSSCVRILRRHIDRIGFDTNFTIYDADDSKSLMKDICKRLEIDTKIYKEKSFLAAISSAKDELITPTELMRRALTSSDYAKRKQAEVYREYQEALHKNNALDFDDLIMKTVELLQSDPEVKNYYQERFHYIMVDEYQDTNTAQFELIRLLAGKYQNLCVVGDDDQSIYKFRGARPELMLNFPKDFENTRQVILNRNYRCGEEIVQVAEDIISYNTKRFEKKMQAREDAASMVEVRTFKDHYEENKHIIYTIKEEMAKKTPLSQIAILYRTNQGPRQLIAALMAYNIPFYMQDAVPNLFDHWISKNIIDYMHLAMGDRKRSTFLRVMNRPKRYISREYLTESQVSFDDLLEKVKDKPWLYEYVEDFKEDLRIMKNMTPLMAINYIRKSVGYNAYLAEYARFRKIQEEEFTQVLEELQESAKGYDTYEAWFDHIKEYTEELNRQSKENQKEKEGVVVSTMHSTKGLEFERVFLPDVNEDVIPHKKSMKEEDVEEERRLFYVGVTRAKKYLHILSVKKLYNKDSRPSRFVEELRSRQEKRGVLHGK